MLAATAAIGALKVITTKYRHHRITKQEDLEKAAVSLYAHVLADSPEYQQRNDDVWDLFGIRALEKGHYGGVSQSSTPITSRAPSYHPGSPKVSQSYAASPFPEGTSIYDPDEIRPA